MINPVRSKLTRLNPIALLGLGLQRSIGFQQQQQAFRHLVSYSDRSTVYVGFPDKKVTSAATTTTSSTMSFSATTASAEVLEKSVLLDEITRQLSLLDPKGNSETKILTTKDDEDGMVEVFSQSFLDDSLMQWIANVPSSLSSEDSTSAVLDLNRWLMRGMNCGILSGERGVAFGIIDKDNGGSMAGVMTVVPSGCSREPNMEKDFSFAPSPTEKEDTKGNYGSDHPQRLDSLGVLDSKCESIMNAEPFNTNKFIYLKAVGVLKEHQGKGYGGRLLKVLFNAADSLKVPTYLETQNEKNVGLYNHFGFELVETITLGGGEEEFLGYLMVRPPK